VTQQSNESTRRGFLDVFIGICSAITAAAVTIPGLMYLWPAAKGGAGGEVEVKGAKNLAKGESEILQVKGKAVLVVRTSSGFDAYSAICPHLGCLVKWEGVRKEFLCPCHAAVFDSKGRVVSGPAPGPLSPYKVKEVGDKVFVSAV
jgi:cytochrome b6-f complex iron-sulfur subunit